ncbi:MAG TPA: aminoacyl-tRNA hydrolase, partial [Polyangiaceae bacterium]|nr:aminoacyl-tRNA hydrolase [Polyangiaceae bacterium]
MLVVGLGNPGERYQATRHNLGFRVIDLIAERWGRPAFRDKFKGTWAQVELPAPSGREKVFLLKPLTFMNLSGESVQPAAAFFKEPPERVLVLHDELDLPLGRL